MSTGIQRAGGQADVFQVRRGEMEGLFALKRLRNPARGRRFAQEVELTKSLHEEFGDAFVEIVDVGRDGEGRDYYVMPWLDRSMQDEVDQSIFIEDPIAGLSRLLELAAILECLHGRPLAHRDLKPANVLVNGAGGLTVADLGLVLDPQADGPDRLTESAEAIGSRYYIAPENEAGMNEAVDQRPADFYAFGKIAWVLMTGARVLAREDQLLPDNTVADRLSDVRLSGVDDLCRLLLHTDPRVRLANWSTVSDELSSVRNELSGGPRIDEQGRGQIAESLAAARAFRTSRVAYEIDRERQRAGERDQVVSELRQLAFAQAEQFAGEVASLNNELGGYFQVQVQAVSLPILRRLLADTAAVAALGPVAKNVSRFNQEEGSTVEFCISELGGQAPTLTIKGWTLVAGDEVWFWRIPVLDDRFSPRVVVGLLDRYSGLDGPYRLGLAGARSGAARFGTTLCADGLALAADYIKKLQAGLDLSDQRSWS
ncbi:MAG: protein kinase [Solirubrobacteraceae bacterium]|nr:protein kinase [Solirubrobacteraceae bacterium]